MIISHSNVTQWYFRQTNPDQTTEKINNYSKYSKYTLLSIYLNNNYIHNDILAL